MSDQASGQPAADPIRGRGRRWSWVVVGVLALLLLVMALAWPSTQTGSLGQVWDNHRALVKNLAMQAAEYAAWLLIGLGLGLALAGAARSTARRAARWQDVAFVGLAGAVGVGLLAMMVWEATVWLAGPPMAVLLGAGLGGLSQRGVGGKVVAGTAVLGLLAAPGVYVANMTDAVFAGAPTVADGKPVRADAKRRLLDKLDAAHERGRATGTAEFTLTQTEIDLLAEWALEITGLDRGAAQVTLHADGSLAVAGSIPAGRRGWVNVDLLGQAGVHEAGVDLMVHHLQLGRWQVPRAVTDTLAERVSRELTAAPNVAMWLAAVRRFEVDDQRLHVAYDPHALPEEVQGQMAGERLPGRVDPLARLYLDELRKLALGFDRKTVREPMLELVRAAFTLASDRSSVGHDPRRENGAAILALTNLCAAMDMNRFLEVTGTREQRRRLNWMPGRMLLHERRDLTKHYWISALLTLTVDAEASGLVGRIKEEMDSAAGGTGFSFVDLLADRAGTRLAEFATSTPTNARLVQARLSMLISADQLMPDPTGLPEGLTEQQFEQRFGSTDSPAYEAMVDRIDQRIESLPLFGDDGT